MSSSSNRNATSSSLHAAHTAGVAAAPNRRGTGTRRGYVRAARSLLTVLVAMAPLGCSDAQIDAAVRDMFQAQQSPAQAFLAAIADEDPDIRLRGVAQMARSDEATQDWAVKGFVTIALIEDNPHVRCTAIRGLGRSNDPRAAETCLKLLNHQDFPPREVRAPDDLCRADAALVLADVARRGGVPEAMLPKARETFLRLLREDDAVDVRRAAARGLGEFQDLEVLEALIAALRDREFGVAAECESSLIRLTGETHDVNAHAWKLWLDEHRATPFARAGQIPESRRPPYDNDWEKGWYETKKLVGWVFPAAKED